MTIQALIFDLDNTLVDRASAHRRYWEDFLSRYPVRNCSAERAAALEELVAQDDSGYRARKEYFSWAANFIGHSNWEAEMLWEDYRTRIALFIQPRIEVNALIESLAGHYSLGVVSNGSGIGQRKKLERAQLYNLFSKVWISQECGFEKPSPEIFLMALEGLNCKPNQSLFIGDDPIRDIAAAAEVGCRTCWVSGSGLFPKELSPPDISITNVTELPEALAAVSGTKLRGAECST
jgi:HAD superfamily hydrolase (TIGR01662 family)